MKNDIFLKPTLKVGFFLLLIVTNFARYGHITFFTMDISLFSRTIKELILENDRVGVPRIGHFLAELMPATFSDCRTMINPPYRRMSFRKDGVTVAERDIFLNKMEEVSGLPSAQVAEEYDMFIRAFISDLESEKSVDLPSLGRMHATSCNEYFFVADEDLDIYPDGIGFEPVSVKAPDPDFVPEAPPEPESTPESESEPAPEITSEPESESISEQESESASISEQELESEPTPAEEPVAESDTEAKQESATETQAEPEPTPEPQTESEPVEVAVIDPETIEDNEFIEEPEAENEPDLVLAPSKKRVGLRVVVAIIALVIVVALLLYFFRDSEWLSPLLDKLLYTKEELRILGR